VSKTFGTWVQWFLRTSRHPRSARAEGGPDRSRADNHGQRQSSLDLRGFTLLQVAIVADLALGAGVDVPTQVSNNHKLRNSEHNDERSPQEPQR
jgi:hypothetical protein